MVKLLKNIVNPDYKLSFWETGTITVKTSITLDPMELIRVMRTDQCIVPESFESFINLINTHNVPDESKSFLFNNEQISSDYIEYLSNDALVRIYKDEMNIDILLSPTATVGSIMSLLENLNINSGIDDFMLNEKIENPDGKIFVVARAAVPIPYMPRQYDFDYITERIKPLPLKQKGRVIFLDLSIQNRVATGGKLATFSEECKSVNGFSVTGHIVPIDMKEKEDVILGNNVYEDRGAVYASKSGMVQFNKECITVLPTLLKNRAVVNKVIDFDGTIILDNNVTNSTITASGDVIICGDAQDTVINCAGFVYCLIGVAGKRSHIKSTYDIFTPFIYHGKLESTEGNIFVAYESMNAKIKAFGPVVVEGKVVGGEVESANSIKIHTAGSERSSTETFLAIQTSKKKEIQYNELSHICKIYEQQAKDMYTQIKRYEIRNSHRRKEFNQDEKYLKMKEIEALITKEVYSLNNQLSSLKAFLKDTQAHRIIVFGNIWNGVTIKINKFDLEIKGMSHASTFKQGQHGIMRSKYA